VLLGSPYLVDFRVCGSFGVVADHGRFAQLPFFARCGHRKGANTPRSGTPLLHRASDTTLGLLGRLGDLVSGERCRQPCPSAVGAVSSEQHDAQTNWPRRGRKSGGEGHGCLCAVDPRNEWRLYDPQRPFTPQWQLRVNQRPLVRGASMPADGHFRLSTRSDSLL
jgi:hypothetical protein